MIKKHTHTKQYDELFVDCCFTKNLNYQVIMNSHFGLISISNHSKHSFSMPLVLSSFGCRVSCNLSQLNLCGTRCLLWTNARPILKKKPKNISSHMHVFGTWKEAEVPKDNPRKHEANIQTPHRGTRAKI